MSKPTTNRINTISLAPRLIPTDTGFVERVARHPVPLSIDVVPDYDSSTEISCPRCSHDDCVHFHSAQRRLDRRMAQGFLRYTENTLFTKHSRREMPHAISGPPLEFDTCHLAAFKYDGVVLPHSQYDRSAHVAAIPAAREDRERRLREKSAKLSAHMRRRHAATAKQRTSHRRATKKSTTTKGGGR